MTKRVFAHENLTMVHWARNLLAQNGIDSFIKNEFHASGGHVGLISIPVELWVSDARDAVRAEKLLRENAGTGDAGASWRCPACGEENGESFELCWRCQTERP